MLYRGLKYSRLPCEDDDVGLGRLSTVYIEGQKYSRLPCENDVVGFEVMDVYRVGLNISYRFLIYCGFLSDFFYYFFIFGLICFHNLHNHLIYFC